MTFLGRVQGCDLPGQVVIPRSRCELVQAHRHTHPKGVHAAGRSGRPESLPAVHRVCGTSDLEIGWGYSNNRDRQRLLPGSVVAAVPRPCTSGVSDQLVPPFSRWFPETFAPEAELSAAEVFLCWAVGASVCCRVAGLG